MGGELGKATYELDADLGPLRRNVKESEQVVHGFERALDALTAVSQIAEEALKQIKITAKQAGESDAGAEAIIAGVRGISDESRDAARELDRIKISETQATESTVAGERIKRNVNDIGDEADKTKRKLAAMRLAGMAGGAGGGLAGMFGGSTGGGGVGPMGTLIGSGALLTPAAGPGAMGLLASTPVLAGAAAGSLGVLALAFQGVGKAIGGDKKAFDDLGPSAQSFVETVRSLDGWFDKLKETAAGSLFPGLTAGLKAALSPGTLSAITAAVTALGHALGQAGAMWGRYFGSAEFQSIFGPLMQSAARTIGNLSTAALKLFDAIGVVARAAIPFTDWMTSGIAKGAQLVDTWLHAKDATGQLGRAMHEAETSLELVGRLLGSLVNVVGSLGSALYPISKIAMKDLTDGLNYLAQLIDRNKQTIREIISTALTGLVTAVKLVVDGIKLLNEGLTHVVGNKAGVVTAILAIGAAIAIVMGPQSAIIAGALLAIGYIADHWEQTKRLLERTWDALKSYAAGIWKGIEGIANLAVAGIVEYFTIGIKAILEAASHIPFIGHYARTALDDINGLIDKFKQTGLHDFAQAGSDFGNAWGDNLVSAATVAMQKLASLTNQTLAQVQTDQAHHRNSGAVTAATSYSQNDVYKLLLANGIPKDVATNLAIISARGEDSSGDPTRLNNNPKTGDYSVGLFQENFLGQMGVDRVRKYAPQFGKNPNMPVAAFVKWLGDHPSAQAQIAYQIFQAQGYGAWTTAAGLGISGGGTPDPTNPFGTPPPWSKNTGKKKPTMPTGANLLTEALRNALQTAKDNAKTASSPSAAATWLHAELADLQQAKKDLGAELKASSGKKKAAIQAELRTTDGAIASVHQQITSNLKDQAKAIKDAFKQPLSTGRAGISSAVELVKASLNAQLQAQLQDQIDNVLGPRFFQGTDEHGMGRRTPLEKQLADMQAADTKTGLNDALTTAQKQLDLDRQTADVTADQLAVDQKAVDQAQRAIDENDLAIRATAERAQADHDYAEAVKQAQADTAEKQRQMDAQLDAINKGLQNGTKSLDDLRNVADAFGVSLTAGGGIVDDFDTLSKAVRALALTLAKEAKSLLGVGDKKDAKAIQKIIDDLNTDNAPPRADGLSTIRGIGAIPMAAGGIGTVKMPTLFLAGEDGIEDFAFSGGGRSFTDSITSNPAANQTIEVPVYLDGLQIARAQKPHADKIITIGH